MEIQSGPREFPPIPCVHACSLPGMSAGRLRVEGTTGWGCRRGTAVTQGPKGPSRAGCGYVGDCHSPVALWAKIAQREVGSFHMKKVCTGLVSVTSEPPGSTVLSDSSAHGSPFREQEATRVDLAEDCNQSPRPGMAVALFMSYSGARGLS